MTENALKNLKWIINMIGDKNENIP
jgi:hypothetical protein